MEGNLSHNLHNELSEAAQILGIIEQSHSLENKVLISLLESIKDLEKERTSLCLKITNTRNRNDDLESGEKNDEHFSGQSKSATTEKQVDDFRFGEDNYNESERSKFYTRLLDIERKLEHEIVVLEGLVEGKSKNAEAKSPVIKSNQSQSPAEELAPTSREDMDDKSGCSTTADEEQDEERDVVSCKQKEKKRNEQEQKEMEEREEQEIMEEMAREKKKREDLHLSFLRYPSSPSAAASADKSNSACWVMIHQVSSLKPSWYTWNREETITYFLDEPVIDPDEYLNYRAEVAIDKKGFISKHQNIAFVVYRKWDSMNSSRAANWLNRLATASTDQERTEMAESFTCPSFIDRIELVSSDMIQSMNRFLQLLPKSVAESWFQSKEMRAPYLSLYHYLDEMRQTADPVLCANENQQYLALLADYVDQHCDFSNADKLISRGIISEEHFSKLFCPGEVIVDVNETPPVAYICDGLPKPVSETVDGGKYTLKALGYHYDGKLRLQTKSLSCNWSGQAISRISDLTLCPVKYAGSELQERLRLRGELFWMCRKKAYICYEDPESELSRPGYSANPRFMVDYETYRELHPEAEIFKEVSGTEVSPEIIEKDKPPRDGHDLIMPHSVIGFAIQDKKWRSLVVDYISPISWNKSAFEKLVLKPAAKELIQALVTVHMVGKRSSDMIEGKGNGLLILLHGPPGTGKTLTAESVAELVQRPLYRVTCGDIGTDAEGVEAYLESVLHIGKIWGCVVLLDEADVFLEERSLADLQRNALVSVFLRILEYYEGILILTSNRVGTFDEAFKSRIKLTLHYNSFTKPDRRKVWRNFIKMMESNQEDNIEYDDLHDNLDNLAEYKMNGREIRNAISTAKELAQFRKQSLSYEHLKHVIQIAFDFEKYLEETRGWTAEEWQKEQGIR